MTEFDPKTNLPAIPEDCYWRVTSPKKDAILYVYLYQRRFNAYLGDLEVVGRTVWKNTPDGIRKAASRALRSGRAKRHFRRQEELAAVEKFIGFYPPNRLGN